MNRIMLMVGEHERERAALFSQNLKMTGFAEESQSVILLQGRVTWTLCTCKEVQCLSC